MLRVKTEISSNFIQVIAFSYDLPLPISISSNFVSNALQFMNDRIQPEPIVVRAQRVQISPQDKIMKWNFVSPVVDSPASDDQAILKVKTFPLVHVQSVVRGQCLV